jgi:hypothetical protein
MIDLVISELKTFTPLDWIVTKVYFSIGAFALVGAALQVI